MADLVALLIGSFMIILFLTFFYRTSIKELYEIDMNSQVPIRILQIDYNDGSVKYIIQAKNIIWLKAKAVQLKHQSFSSIKERKSISFEGYTGDLSFDDYEKAQDFVIEYDFNREEITRRNFLLKETKRTKRLEL